MPGLLETDTITSQDITSSLLVGSYTASAAGLVMPQVRLNSLNGAAAVITLKMVLNDGTNDHPHARGSDLKDADADTRFARDLSPVWMSSGDVLKVYAVSTNASDTSVSGSVRFIDAGNPVDGVDVSQVDGSTTAAANLKLAADDNYTANRGLAGAYLDSLGQHFVDSISDVTIGAPSSETSFDVANGDRFREGNVIRVEGSAELMYVSGVTGDTLTVVRGYLGTTTEAIADTQTLLISPFTATLVDIETQAAAAVASAQAVVLAQTSGLTVYAQFFNEDGDVWNGSTFETYNASNWTDYDVVMTEVDTTKQYRVAIPDGDATHFVAYSQAGGTPASSDTRLTGNTL